MTKGNNANDRRKRESSAGGGKNDDQKDNDDEEKFEQLSELCRSENPSLTALETFRNENPKFLRSVTKSSARSLLTSLCHNYKVSLEMVRLLLSIFPNAAAVAPEGEEDHDGHTALSAACFNPFAGFEIVQYLILACPKALLTKVRGDLPIHEIIRRYIFHKELRYFEHPPLSMDILELLVSQCPETLLQKDSSGKLPIHILCTDKWVSLDALKLLVEAAPETLTVRGGFYGCFCNGTPLFCLLDEHRHARQPELEMVRYLVEKEPEALQMVCGNNGYDVSESLPLHSACRNVSGETQAPIVRFLLDSCPQSIRAIGYGKLPLHEACLNEKCSTLQCIQYLVEAYPQALTTHDVYGFIPTQYAIRTHDRDVLQFLIGYDSEIASRTDYFTGGFLLHRAVGNPHVESLEYVYKLNPIAIEHPKNGGNLPLHEACAWGDTGSTASNLEFLIAKFPQGAKEPNSEGMFPLHLQCSHFNVKEDKLAIVYRAFPEAIKIRDKKGRLPFHSSCANNNSLPRSLQNVHALYPEATSMADNDGNLPLHLVAKAKMTIIDQPKRFIYNLHPEHISWENHKGEIPFHLLLCNHVSEEFFDELVKAFPEGLDIYHKTLGFPLHCATSEKSEAKEEIVLKLYMKRYETRVFEILSLPLHVVLQDRELGKIGPSGIVQWFISNYGAHIRDKDRQGRTPLHFAVTAKLEKNVLNQLLKADPEALQVPDKHGSLPLHYCLRHGDPNGVASKLIGLYPESIHFVDCQGFLPIHVGCRKGAHLETIRQILELEPAQCLAADHAGELPLHKSCRAGDVDITRLLFKLRPDTVGVRNKAGFLPVTLLSQSSGKLKGADNGNESLDTIWSLLLMHPDAVRQ